MGTPAAIMAREDSVPVGVLEHRIWKPFGDIAVALTPGVTCNRAGTKKEAWRFSDALVDAARKYDHQGKLPGDRMGPLGPSGIKVLEALLEIADKMTGRMEPAIATICEKAKLARGTVCRALVRLKNEGFLAWIRRKQLLDNDGAGPQVHQASHAYFFKLKGKAEGLVRLALAKLTPKRRSPPPDGALAHVDRDRSETEAMLAKASAEQVARYRLGDSPLGDAVAQLGRSIDSSENSIESRNPDP